MEISATLSVLRDDCRDEGLECCACVETAARDIASVCQELDDRAVATLFLRLYTRRSCRSMVKEFQVSYRRNVERIRIEAGRRAASEAAQCA